MKSLVNRRRASMIAAAAVIGLAAAGVAAAQGLSKEVIKIGTGVDPAFSAIYYANQHKLFAKHGLNVELVKFTQGGDAVDAMVAGQVQFSTSAESTIMVRATRADVRGLAIYSEQTAFLKFVVRSGLTEVKQAKKLGVVVGSVSEYLTVKLLQKYNIDEKSVEFVKGAPPEFPALLARGNIDGYFLWEPWPSNGVKQGGKVLVVNGEVGYVPNMLIAAMGPWFESHKAETVAFLKALDEACKALTADLSKAGEAVQAEIKLPAAQANELLKGIGWAVRDFSDEDVARYKEVVAFQVSRKITAKPADVDKFVQKGFVTTSVK